MNCSDFRQALDESLDGGGTPGIEVRAHAEACRDGECRQAWDDFRLVALAVRSFPTVESPELVERVLAALPAASRPATFHRGAPLMEPAAARRRTSSTALNLVMVLGVLVAAVLGLRPRPTLDVPPVARHTPHEPAGGSLSSATMAAVEPIIPLHLAARAPALLTDTVNGRFDRESIRDLPVVTPLMSAVTETFRPMGQELEEWVRQFQAAPEETMDNSTQVFPAMPPVT